MATQADKDWAHGLVSEFRKRTANVVWFNCQRAQVADDLDKRIDDPFLISQNDTQWCGYASTLFHSASHFPQHYAWYVIGLFEDGRGYLGATSSGPKVRIEVSESVRRAMLPSIRGNAGSVVQTIPQADYIALAALRNHFKTALAGIAENVPLLNLIDDIGGSGGGELCNALKKLGCTTTYDQSTVFSTRELGFLNAASGHFDLGRYVILFIDASLLKNGVNKGRGNHWVALASSVTYSADKKTVSFEVFSWGKKYAISEAATAVQARFFGYVVGF